MIDVSDLTAFVVAVIGDHCFDDEGGSEFRELGITRRVLHHGVLFLAAHLNCPQTVGPAIRTRDEFTYPAIMVELRVWELTGAYKEKPQITQDGQLCFHVIEVIDGSRRTSLRNILERETGTEVATKAEDQLRSWFQMKYSSDREPAALAQFADALNLQDRKTDAMIAAQKRLLAA